MFVLSNLTEALPADIEVIYSDLLSDSCPYMNPSLSLFSSVFLSRPSSPKSDSELLVKTQESSGPQMEWNWGGFPMVRQHKHTNADADADVLSFPARAVYLRLSC